MSSVQGKVHKDDARGRVHERARGAGDQVSRDESRRRTPGRGGGRIGGRGGAVLLRRVPTRRRRGVAVAVRRVRHRGAHVLRRTRVRAAWKMVLRTMPRNGGRVRGSARWWVESTPTTSRGGVARSGHFVTVGWRRRSRADERAQGGSRASRGESASTWGNTSTRGRRRAIGDAQSLGRRRRRSS